MLVTTVVAGVLPAVQALGTAPGDVLRKSRRGSTGAGTRSREFLTLGQVGLSTVLLIGAGLFVQSLRNTLEVDVGYDYESLMNVSFEAADGVGNEQVEALYREARGLIEGMPGVESAVLSTSSRALYGWNEHHGLRASRIDSLPRVPQGGPFTYTGTEGFVETAGLRVLQGRAFEPGEYALGGPPTIMVSRSLAEGVWPGLDPLQECVFLQDGTIVEGGIEPCRPVVGVYEDLIVSSIGDRDRWSVIWPHPEENEGIRGILVRANQPMDLAQPIREQIAALSGGIRYVHAIPMESRIEAMRGPWRVGATLFSAFGILALLVASLGLYSVLAFGIARRSREIGIRAALGAQRGDLVAMVMSRATRLVAFGLVLGFGIAAFTGRFLQSLLFGVPTVNPTVFGVVALTLLAAGLIAAWVPAWKATSIDPVGAMAAE